jgi:hypothetical protein
MPFPPEIESDIAAILAEFGDPVEWNGQSILALVSDAGLGDAQALGGWIEQGSLTVKLLRSSFDGDLPALGDLLTFNGEQYRVIRIESRPSRPIVVLTCAAKDE